MLSGQAILQTSTFFYSGILQRGRAPEATAAPGSEGPRIKFLRKTEILYRVHAQKLYPCNKNYEFHMYC